MADKASARSHIVGLAVAWGVAGMVFHYVDAHSTLAMYDTVSRKLGLANQPDAHAGRIVLLGGSNVQVGLSAAVMRAALHRPVINLGVAEEAYGPENYRALFDDSLKPGDTVVMSFMSWFEKRPPGAHAATLDASIKDRRAPQTFGWEPLPETRIIRWFDVSDAPYWTKFDEFGDSDCRPTGDVSAKTSFSYHMSAEQQAFWRDWTTALRARHIRVAFSIPRILVRTNDTERARAYFGSLIALISDIAPVIDDDPDQIVRTDPSEFCDSFIHLAPTKRADRTLQAASKISNLDRPTTAGGPRHDI